MKIQRVLVVLTIANLALLLFALAAMRPVHAQGTPSMLRGRGLEIVDAQGRVRASISVLPAGRSEHGDAYPETVLLRLITERGRPAVKISTSEEASAMALIGPTGTKNTYAIVEASGAVSRFTLKNEDGREQTVKP